MPTLIDCSIAIENDLSSDPPMMIPKIKGAGAGWIRAVALVDD